MSKEDFNPRCAKFMGYRLEPGYLYEGHRINAYTLGSEFICLEPSYNPHDDLNQLAEVFDKAAKEKGFDRYDQVSFMVTVHSKGIKQAMRDFVTEAL